MAGKFGTSIVNNFLYLIFIREREQAESAAAAEREADERQVPPTILQIKCQLHSVAFGPTEWTTASFDLSPEDSA